MVLFQKETKNQLKGTSKSTALHFVFLNHNLPFQTGVKGNRRDSPSQFLCCSRGLLSTTFPFPLYKFLCFCHNLHFTFPLLKSLFMHSYSLGNIFHRTFSDFWVASLVYFNGMCPLSFLQTPTVMQMWISEGHTTYMKIRSCHLLFLAPNLN